MSPSDSGFPTGTPLAWDTSTSGPPATMPPFTSQTTATGYVPGSPDHAHHGSFSGVTGEGSSPTVASSRKAFDCPFCLEVGISDGASRISDLRRHFRTKHNTNAQWHCNFVGCHQIFDWQSAYEGHLKKAHPDADKNFVLSPSEAMVPCNIQVIFACGFDTCRKVFETPPDGDASATAKDYFHHVANHFQDGTTTEEWYYTRRIRNLLHQSGVRDTWKALKPRYGTAVPLRWQPHNSTILRKKLECRDVPDSKRLVELAVVLGSHPFNSPDSPQLPSMTGEYAAAHPMDGMAWRPHTPTVQPEAPSRAHPIRMRSLHGTPSPPIRGSPHMQAPSIAAPHPQGHLASSAPTSHPSGLRMDVDPHSANAVNAPYEWGQSLYQFSGMDTMGGFSTPQGVLSMDHGSDEYQPARSQG